jgi:FkbH-like protein
VRAPINKRVRFQLAFTDPQVLLPAGTGAITGRYAHLRLVSLAPRADVEPIVADLPIHVQQRVMLDPSPELMASGELHAMLTRDKAATQALFPEVAPDDILTWEDVPTAYQSWLQASYLPASQDRLYTPDGLFPEAWHHGPLQLEVIGSCGAVHVREAIPDVARQLNAEITSFHTVQNHPFEAGSGSREAPPDLRLVLPPLRYMHPATLDDFVTHRDHEALFNETVAHMATYMDSVLAGGGSVDLYVGGFIEPYMNPAGLFFPARDLSNFKYFVRRLNDELVAWCERCPNAHFVDVDEIAAAIGKAGVDEGPLTFYSHRGPLDVEYDDNTDSGYPTIPVRLSFDIRTAAFSRAVVRDVLHRHVIRSQRDRVKAVIVDLDNTLWRGLAADGDIGSWNGRPQGLVEALKILKQRGLFIAIASKNDEGYVREHWDDILHRWPEVPLTSKLSLEDFDAVRIDFRPKSVTVAEVLDQLNVLPEHAVFIDDNPLERENVQAAFPQMRILGSELNYVRRELIHSPFTQSDFATAEDRLRAQTVKQQASLTKHLESGTADEFLASLELRCHIVEVTVPNSAEAARALQLINKTNQWSLNGARTTDADLRAALHAGHRLITAPVRDAHHDYGIVAAALIDAEQNRITHLAISCRVIGMGIDDAIVSRFLLEYGPLTLAYAPTDRNRAASAALQRWTSSDPCGDTVLIRVDAPSHVHVELSKAPALAMSGPQ